MITYFKYKEYKGTCEKTSEGYEGIMLHSLFKEKYKGQTESECRQAFIFLCKSIEKEKANQIKAYKLQNGYRIDKKYTIDEIHNLFREWDEKYGPMSERKKKKIRVEFDRHLVKTFSQRYELFLKNIKCVRCGLEANYYILEKREGAKAYHFNLYYIDDDNEILFTKDHIIPVSKGGLSILSNYQTMCIYCNHLKGTESTDYRGEKQ